MTLFDWYCLRFGHGKYGELWFRPDGYAPYVCFPFKDFDGRDLSVFTAITFPG